MNSSPKTYINTSYTQEIASLPDIICSICLDTEIGECIQKWDCSHRFHSQCASKWNGNCPYCQTSQRICSTVMPNMHHINQHNKRCILDINIMKQMYKNVHIRYQDAYKNTWKDRHCIDSNHNIIYVQLYGVLGICEDCDTTQSYNLMHPY